MRLKKQFAIFVLVGILNTIVGFGFYALFLTLGLHYMAAVLLSTFCGVTFNYFSTRKLVFAKNSNSSLIYFLAAYTLIYFLNVGSIKFFTILGFDHYGAYILSVPILAVISFALMKWFVFVRD